MDRDELLRQITILDFMATDLHLYLNTHPSDDEAVCAYNEVITNVEKLRYYYEKKFGPLCSFRSMGCEGWKWECEPWPWEAEYNFSM